MKLVRHLMPVFLVVSLSLLATAQGTTLVHDPTKPAAEAKLSPKDDAVLKEALRAVRKAISSETCEEDVSVGGSARGSFTRSAAAETLIFYQYCQTGNGYGWVGLILSENGKVSGNFISEAGWSVGLGKVADLDGNGLDEFTLAYSGGLHQGQGGVGVDLMQFTNGTPAGIGWYKAEEFGPTESSTSWKLTAQPGTPPRFYKQKYASKKGGRPRRVGATVVTKLGKPYSKFSPVK